MKDYGHFRTYCDECEMSSVDWKICKGICLDEDYGATGVCPLKCKKEGLNFIDEVKKELIDAERLLAQDGNLSNSIWQWRKDRLIAYLEKKGVEI